MSRQLADRIVQERMLAERYRARAEDILRNARGEADAVLRKAKRHEETAARYEQRLERDA